MQAGGRHQHQRCRSAAPPHLVPHHHRHHQQQQQLLLQEAVRCSRPRVSGCRYSSSRCGAYSRERDRARAVGAGHPRRQLLVLRATRSPFQNSSRGSVCVQTMMHPAKCCLTMRQRRPAAGYLQLTRHPPSSDASTHPAAARQPHHRHASLPPQWRAAEPMHLRHCQHMLQRLHSA